MRRALLLAAALAVPAHAAAQAIPAGTVQFVEPGTTNDIVHGQWINATKCAAQATTDVVLQWTVQMAASTPFPSGGSYQIYAANQDMAANTIECPKLSVSASGLVANPVGEPRTALTQGMTDVHETVQKFLTAVNQTSCAITSQVIIYVCVQLTSGTTSVGFAKGQLKFSVAKPGTPTSVSAEPIESTKLRVKWSAPTGDPQAYDYIVTAHSAMSPTDLTKNPKDVTDYRIGPTDPHASEVTLGGLTDDVLYAVYVTARSEAANEGNPAGPAFGIPQVVRDFWDEYRSTPGAVEQGGCATAGAGSLAIAGLAALIVARRRRK
jgi:hypothetical protein